jgi:CheY-like chemotaxis protein
MNSDETIFIIDDDVVFVFVLKKMFSKIGCTSPINNAKNGHDGLEYLKHLHENNLAFPKIIFLDINMPMLDGWQFLDEVENLTFKNQLSIYLVSSTIDSREIEKAKTYETVKKFISKPISLVDLADIVATA